MLMTTDRLRHAEAEDLPAKRFIASTMAPRRASISSVCSVLRLSICTSVTFNPAPAWAVEQGIRPAACSQK